MATDPVPELATCCASGKSRSPCADRPPHTQAGRVLLCRRREQDNLRLCWSLQMVLQHGVPTFVPVELY